MDGWLQKIQIQVLNRFSLDRQKTKHGKFDQQYKNQTISQAINKNKILLKMQ
jgi:hypothetical protein